MISSQNKPRRQIAYIGPWNSIILDKCSPSAVVFWSIAFSGFGHIFLGKYFRGFILLTGEIYLNAMSHLNLAIYYSLAGKYDSAKAILDSGWFILYILVYTYAIYDSYREAVEINKTSVLASREDFDINCFSINSGSFTNISNTPPLHAVICSIILPGSGCILVQRMNKALFIMIVWIANAYLSGVYPAIIYTFQGEYELAKSALNIQWFLNIPFLWFFSIYETYSSILSNNKLFCWELSKYLQREYQRNAYKALSNSKETGSLMQIFSVFEQSLMLEMAVTELQMKGISKEAILAVPLNGHNEDRLLFGSVNNSDSTNLLTLPMMSGMIFTLLGSFIGFQLRWGPIWWAVIGAASGFLAGLLVRLIIAAVFRQKLLTEKTAGVILVVECEPDKAEMTKSILWSNTAKGVGNLNI